MKKIFIFFLMLTIYGTATSQINKSGIPFIKNYTPLDYNGGTQNWAICQDHRGVIYVGNQQDGVLVYEGNKWEKIAVPNNEVRSLAVDSSGCVYVGGNDEFGYLTPDKDGKIYYHSVRNVFTDTVDVKKIWKIYTLDDLAYFCSTNYIFVFKDRKFLYKIHDNEGAFLSFLVNGKLYWGNYYKGLQYFNGDSLQIVKNGEHFVNKDIFVLLPYDEHKLFVGTMQQGCYIYDIESGDIKNIKNINDNYVRLSDKLIKGQLYNGILLNDGNYAFSTINDGCLIVDKAGNVIQHYSKNNGLPQITVTCAFQDKMQGLWLGSVDGLSYVEYGAPFTLFDSHFGLDGIISCVKEFNGIMYIGTTVGLYYLVSGENKDVYFKKVKGVDDFIWDLSIIVLDNGSKKLIAGTSRNTLEIESPDNVFNINKDEYTNCYFIAQSRQNPNRIFVGFEHGLNSITYDKEGWKYKEKYFKVKDEITTVVEDNNGFIWAGTNVNGIIKLKNDTCAKRYGIDQGLPYLENNKVFFIDGRILAATQKGIYVYDKTNDIFKKFQGFSDYYSKKDDPVKIIVESNENKYWIVSKNKNTNLEYLEKVIIDEHGTISIENIPFKRLLNSTFNDVVPDGENGAWIACSDAVYHYRENNTNNYSETFYSLINRVEVSLDSIQFYGNYYNDTVDYRISLLQPEILKKTLNYNNNSLHFYFSCPYFPEKEIKYSTRLLGYEDKWSAWIERADKEFTNLREGKYTFQIKAKNIYGLQSVLSSYEFTIKPPWFRTFIAYVLYFILAICVIIIIVKIYTRRLEREKIRLEQIVKERTEEVVKQKDEIKAQRDEIADKNRSITDSIEYASRIQTAVLPSNDFANEILPEHFILFRPRDIVSGDFYWMTKKDDLIVIIAADCTGHGVPGAFMSMLGVSFLNEIVNRHEVNSAGEILTQLRADVKKTLGQKGKEGEAKDGMDIALCIVDIQNMKMQYAGAYNPLYLYRNNELLEVKADRMPIGIYVKEKESFTNNEINLQKGDTFYIFSDGYQDQFGGEDGSKFKTKNFKQLLLEIHQKPMAEQRDILDSRIDEWRGKWEQVDDIIVLGVRV